VLQPSQSDNDENERMIRSQIVARGISDARVLDAFRAVPRQHFVPYEHRASAFDDTPLPLQHKQTISQPYIVALMTVLLKLQGHERVLEIGVGSGYQTAILARLAKHVYGAELEPDLARSAAERLAHLGFDNVTIKAGSGLEVFRSEAPFDAILAAAAPVTFPEALLDQLVDGGRCVIPVGAFEDQTLWLVEKKDGRVVKSAVAGVRFVPLR